MPVEQKTKFIFICNNLLVNISNVVSGIFRQRVFDITSKRLHIDITSLAIANRPTGYWRTRQIYVSRRQQHCNPRVTLVKFPLGKLTCHLKE